MDLMTGLALIASFFVVVGLIVRGQSPIVMLLVLAIAWAVIAGVPPKQIQVDVLQAGGVKFAGAVIIILFGAWFAQVIIQTGIAESIVRSAAELAGDRPVVTAIVINTVIALLFTSLYGVGAAIALGVIALPILQSQGIPARVATPIYTMAIGAGCFVNLVQFNILSSFFPGVKFEAPYLTFWAICMVIYMLVTWIMIGTYVARIGVRRMASIDVAAPNSVVRKRVPYYTYIAPIFPVFLVVVFHWEIIPTFLFSIVLTLALTWKDRTFQGHINLFNKTFYDAVPDIANIAALMTICGMIIACGMTPQVAGALRPIFNPILPHTTLGAAIFFGLLGGIGSIYRGPLVIFGTGAALVAIFLGNRDLPHAYLYSLWATGSMMQGSIDPTNSWTLWAISHTKVSHGEFLRVAFPFGCLMVVLTCATAYLMLG